MIQILVRVIFGIVVAVTATAVSEATARIVAFTFPGLADEINEINGAAWLATRTTQPDRVAARWWHGTDEECERLRQELVQACKPKPIQKQPCSVQLSPLSKPAIGDRIVTLEFLQSVLCSTPEKARELLEANATTIQDLNEREEWLRRAQQDLLEHSERLLRVHGNAWVSTKIARDLCESEKPWACRAHAPYLALPGGLYIVMRDLLAGRTEAFIDKRKVAEEGYTKAKEDAQKALPSYIRLVFVAQLCVGAVCAALFLFGRLELPLHYLTVTAWGVLALATTVLLSYLALATIWLMSAMPLEILGYHDGMSSWCGTCAGAVACVSHHSYLAAVHDTVHTILHNLWSRWLR